MSRINYTEYSALIGGIAQNLNAEYDVSEVNVDHYANIVTPDFEIKAKLNSKKDRVTFSIELQKDLQNNKINFAALDREISVSVERDVNSITKDIERKIIPAAREYMAIAKAKRMEGQGKSLRKIPVIMAMVKMGMSVMPRNSTVPFTQEELADEQFMLAKIELGVRISNMDHAVMEIFSNIGDDGFQYYLGTPGIQMNLITAVNEIHQKDDSLIDFDSKSALKDKVINNITVNTSNLDENIAIASILNAYK